MTDISTPGAADEVFDLRVESRFKNALLYKALHERFQTTAEQFRKSRYGVVPLLKTAAEVTGVSAGTISNLLCLNASPFLRKSGGYKSAAILLAEALDRTPEELFPASLYALKLPKIVVREFASPQVISLQEAAALHLLAPDSTQEIVDRQMEKERLENSIRKVLATLRPRDEKIIRLRFGIGCEREHTQAEIAQELDLSTSRVSQILMTVMRILRYPGRSDKLRRYLPERSGHETTRL